MKTKNNLLDKDEKIIQIMPLPELRQDLDKDGPLWPYRVSNIDDNGRPYYAVGAALTDKGNIYALHFDGLDEFFVSDPMAGRVFSMMWRIGKALESN